MTNLANRRRKVKMPQDIRKKFGAALVMLLIAAIMLVSSTFAWFTLSTAPEVTGIATSVGSNGNLEIALLNGTNYASTADDLGVQTNVGDSIVTTTDWLVTNNTWGNLLDLATVYGLNLITLNPVALNITNPTAGSGFTLGTSPFKAPSYGNDGRVISVNRDTVFGSLNAQGTAFNADVTDDPFEQGARAIGVASNITVRDTQFRRAVSAVTTNTNNAKNAAQAVLTTYGADLSALLIQVAASDSATFQAADVAVFENIIDDLEAANAYVFNAIKQATLAYRLSSSGGDIDDADVLTVVADVNAATTIADLCTAVGIARASLPSYITDAMDQYEATAQDIAAAETARTTNLSGAGPFTDTQVKAVLDTLLNRSNITVAGVVPLGQNKDALKQAVMVEYNARRPVPIVMGAGSGIFYDLAKNAGNFDASVTAHIADGGVLSSSLNGIALDVDATLETDAADPIYLESAITGVNALTAAGGSGASQLDETYGYALYFGFRTNAATGSKLLLSDAQQRIYNQTGNVSANPDTAGAGSFVQFTTANEAVFSVDDIRALSSAIRVVFVVPNDDDDAPFEIIAMAAPDITATTTAGVTTYTGGTATDEDNDNENDTLKVNLALYNFTVEAAATAGDAPVVTLGQKRADFEITTLTQNVGKKVTAIVYLDGDIVDNTMVANAATSMTGKLNLQFATDAQLVPMDNATLFNGNGGNGGNGGNSQNTVQTSPLTTLLTAVGQYIGNAQANQGQTVADELVSAYNAADAVNSNANATQQQVDDAYDALSAAAAAYVAAYGQP